MSRLTATGQRVFIASMILVASICATIVLLLIVMPRQVQHAATNDQDSISFPEAVTENIPKQVGIPSTLSVAAINVDTVIKPAGLTANGNMAIAENPKEVAWYQYGPRPGEKGSAVIAGHYGWKGNAPSIFNDVNTLKKGDKITVTTVNEMAITFAVTGLRTYAPDDDARDVFSSSDGVVRLNLITCQGDWSDARETYMERLVVFSELVQ